MLWARGAVTLTPPVRDHYCPGCGQTGQTRETLPHTRMHSCSAAGGMTVPMVPAGVKAKLVINERQDYVGDEMVQTDDAGRPIMSVNIVRDEGMDCTVYAPCATAKIGG